MAVLEERARNKQALWHPLDAKYEGDTHPMEILPTVASQSELLAA